MSKVWERPWELLGMPARRHTLLMPLYIYRVRIWSRGPSNLLTRSPMWTDRHLKTGMLRTNDCHLCNDHILLTEFNDGSNLRSSWRYSKHLTHWAASPPPHPSLIKTLTFQIDSASLSFLCLHSSCCFCSLYSAPPAEVKIQEEKKFRNVAYFLWSSHMRCSFGMGAEYHSGLHC